MGSQLKQRGSATDTMDTMEPSALTNEEIIAEIEYQLYMYHELPEWQKDNSYILSGYVKETSSFRKCFGSLRYMHNESVNIYTHLVPALIAILLSYIYTFHYLPVYDTTTGVDRFFVFQFFVGLSACLGLSSTFHCFKCHSLRISKVGNQLDYLGIIILISTSLVSVVYFAYWDHESERNFFILLTAFFSIICTVMTLNSKFSSSDWRPTRTLMFVLFGLSGAIPILYGGILYGFDLAKSRASLGWMVSEGVLYIFGAFLYAMRFPERTNPGKYDFIGNSHQIFHVFVVLAAICHAIGLIKSYQYCHEHTIPDYIPIAY